MNRLLYVSLFTFIFSLNSLAQNSDWIISPTVLFSNKRVEKGALIWDTPFLITAAAINYKNKFLLGNGGISYQFLNTEKSTFALSYGQFNDDKARFALLNYLGKFEEDYKNERKATTQMTLSYLYRPSRATRINLQWEKDLNAHHQNYYQISLSKSILPLISLDLTYGYGDQKHNKFMYGDSAQSGPTHLDYGLGVMLPFLPWKGIMRIMYSQSQILQKSAVNGFYIRGEAKQDRLMAIAFWVL